MNFCEDFPRLEPHQQERFQQVVTRLLSGHVLTPGTPMRPDPDWKFTERYRDLIDGYLRIGGWRLEYDDALRLCRAVHQEGEQRVRFSKLESLILCLLRLIYHEQMREARDEFRCELTVGEIKERLIQSGRPVHHLSRGKLTEALRRLNRYSLIEIDRGFDGTDVEPIVVAPLIEKVLPSDRIAEIHERVRAYNGHSDADMEALFEEAAEPVEPYDGQEGK